MFLIIATQLSVFCIYLYFNSKKHISLHYKFLIYINNIITLVLLMQPQLFVFRLAIPSLNEPRKTGVLPPTGSSDAQYCPVTQYVGEETLDTYLTWEWGGWEWGISVFH